MRYEKEIIIEALKRIERYGLTETHQKVIQLVGRDKRVLDIGCANGYLMRELVKNGCSVVGVEIDPFLAEKVPSSVGEVIIGDFEDQMIKEKIANKGKFDVILMIDLIEHLFDPWKALDFAKSLLKNKGFLLITFPNIAYYKMRLQLLLGKWEYTDTGILDRTHLRFFNRKSFINLLEKSGLKMEKELITEGSYPFRPILLKLGFFKRIDKVIIGLYPTLFGSHFLIQAVLESND